MAAVEARVCPEGICRKGCWAAGRPKESQHRQSTGADRSNGSRWRLSSHRDDPERGKLRLASQCIITPKRDETEESISDGNAVSAAGRHQQGGIEGHRTGGVNGRDALAPRVHLRPSGRQAGRGGVWRRLPTLHMERLAKRATSVGVTDSKGAGGGRQQGRARYGRGGARCAEGEASVAGQSRNKRAGRNVSTRAKRSESEISGPGMVGRRREGGGPQNPSRKQGAGSRKQEAGNKNQVGQATPRE